MIGDNIRRYRELKKLKGIELARILGISSGTLSDIENNKNSPNADTLSRFAKETDVNIDWLLTGEGEILKSICAETHNPYEARILALLKSMDEDSKRCIEVDIRQRLFFLEWRNQTESKEKG